MPRPTVIIDDIRYGSSPILGHLPSSLGTVRTDTSNCGVAFSGPQAGSSVGIYWVQHVGLYVRVRRPSCPCM